MGKNRYPIGLKFNHLTITKYLGVIDSNDKNHHTFYECQCDCGKIINIRAQHIGVQKSCGCAPRNNNRYKSYNVSKEDNMKLVREGAFETNSSSTHSLTMCISSVYEDWKAGKLVYDADEDKFYSSDSKELRDHLARNYLQSKCTYDWDSKTYWDGDTSYTSDELFSQEMLDSVTDKEIESYKEDEWYDIPYTYSEWVDHYGEEYELFEDTFTTPSGDQVVSFGYYGYN